MAQPLLALSQEIKDNKTLRSDASIAQIIGYTMIELARSRGGSGFVLSLVRMISEEVVQGITFNVDGTRNLVRSSPRRPRIHLGLVAFYFCGYFAAANHTRRIFMDFERMTSADRWLFGAHILLAAGTFALAIGNLLRVSQEGTVPQQPMFNTNLGSLGDASPLKPQSARDYFL
ncbi:MAG: hypothetical protein HY074_00180 [Deltaproteobacteria bacterium]|nr:hypothetical protein [Deltaproteobacteria bacterium]